MQSKSLKRRDNVRKLEVNAKLILTYVLIRKWVDFMCIGIEGSDLICEDCSGHYAHKILVVTSEENRPLGRSRYRRKNNTAKEIKTRMKGRILV
jgi:hypothetical protein